MRARVYVDGFNLYYGSLKGTPFKWLNLLALAQQFVGSGTTIEHIRYFTARVSGKPDPDVPKRQNAYLAALSSLGLVTVHYGKFLAGVHTMPLANPGPKAPKFTQVIRTEEKGSDVNLATFLVLDGCDKLYDLAIVISNDSDLKEAVAQVNARMAQVWVLNPNVRFSNALKSAASRYLPIPAANLAAAQFSDPVVMLSGKKIYKPKSW